MQEEGEQQGGSDLSVNYSQSRFQGAPLRLGINILIYAYHLCIEFVCMNCVYCQGQRQALERPVMLWISLTDPTASVAVTRAVAIAPKVHLYTGMVGGKSKRLRMKDTNSDAGGRRRAARGQRSICELQPISLPRGSA